MIESTCTFTVYPLLPLLLIRRISLVEGLRCALTYFEGAAPRVFGGVPIGFLRDLKLVEGSPILVTEGSKPYPTIGMGSA